MRRFACIFPGQGSQAIGMASELLNDPFSDYVFDEANEALGFDLKKLMVIGPEDELILTANAQPAILTTSFAAWKHLVKAVGYGKFPAYVAGHSLGEFSAITASGALEFRDAVQLVHTRGKMMQSAVPEGVGSMVALMGAKVEKIENLIDKVRKDQVLEIANFNTPTQTVISGHAEAVDRAIDIADKFDVKRVVKLKVSAPFHSALMEPVSERFFEKLKKVRFSDPMTRIVHNVTGLPNKDLETAIRMLSLQIVSPVRWVESIQKMLDDEIDIFIEVGYGNVLQGLVKKIVGKEFGGIITGCANPEDAEKVAELVE